MYLCYCHIIVIAYYIYGVNNHTNIFSKCWGYPHLILILGIGQISSQKKTLNIKFYCSFSKISNINTLIKIRQICSSASALYK